ncbi:16S rRNA processing protein RimM [Isoptericola sp. CG 20/1183]|uniref:Ribosome maturation factor RimM n=1 Tax=Isoptericola halotolerans TaxID=300560 RepID=A0ABX5ECV6_9MICO|nr:MULTISPECIES: ribosome maturation factor RimM [Isoptericola]PRZ05675.1 16S rRNA processing protein RimM [Isoptericola halotolerans]PRZ06243.1 16S rRNA processing protein RimM [Isoptericola sp. CG 20/1183]
MELVVARIGKAHGLRGEVALDVRTDVPEERFTTGAVLATVPPDAGPLTVAATRVHQGRWLVQFAESSDRGSAEALRGVELVVESGESDEEDAWYPHELAGLRAELADGTVVGEVVGLEHLPAHDVLVLRETGGERTLVPFVHAIVPVVDVPGGRVQLTPPGGLLARDAGAVVVDRADDGPEQGSDEHEDEA